MKLLIVLFFIFSSSKSLSQETSEIFFHVYRNNDKIGYHRVNIIRNKEDTTANIEINFKVKFLGFTVYTYLHRNTERWKNGKLYYLNSSTNKNGNTLLCKISKNKNTLTSNGTNSEKNFLISSLPTSYWSHQLVEKGNIKKLINTQDCSQITMSIEKIGEEEIYNGNLNATHFKITGKEITGDEVNIDIWYDQNKNWVKMNFLKDGSQIKYTLDKYYEQ